LRRYDGSIDCYLTAASLKSMERPATGTVPGRNDALDVAHFIYVSKESTVVTDDSRLSELAERVGLRAQRGQAFLEWQ
jgi:hypothetical protein